uniref:Uncharacterized protein n=1 Tax=Arundo donax TaxID=35708 RepID=A0A0A8YLN5_ARUDO
MWIVNIDKNMLLMCCVHVVQYEIVQGYGHFCLEL